MIVSKSAGNRKLFLGKENVVSRIPCWEIQLGLALRTWQAGRGQAFIQPPQVQLRHTSLPEAPLSGCQYIWRLR